MPREADAVVEVDRADAVDREAEALAADELVVPPDQVDLVPELVQPAGEVPRVALDAADEVAGRQAVRHQADTQRLRGAGPGEREQRRRRGGRRPVGAPAEEAEPQPTGEPARPLPGEEPPQRRARDLPLLRELEHVADVVLPGGQAERPRQAARQRVPAVLEAVVGVVLRDDPPVADERRAQMLRGRRIVPHAGLRHVHRLIARAREAQGHVRVVAVVGDVLVEAADRQQGGAAIRAVAADRPANPAVSIRLRARAVRADEHLEPVVGRQAARELHEVRVAVQRGAADRADPALGIRGEDRDDGVEPCSSRGPGVVVDEDDDVPRRLPEAEVACGGHVRHRAVDHLDAARPCGQHARRVVRRRSVDHDHLEAVEVEVVKRRQQPLEVARPIVRRDDDRGGEIAHRGRW
jgi:hypothetical protein